MINQGFEFQQSKRNKRKRNYGEENDLDEKLRDGFDLLNEEDVEDSDSNLLTYDKDNNDE